MGYLELDRGAKGYAPPSLEEFWWQWYDRIPYITFPAHWQVRAVPPRRGALIRYEIKTTKAAYSVYLDVLNNLGYMDSGPYWEVYDEEECYRCLLEDTKKLIPLIKKLDKNK